MTNERLRQNRRSFLKAAGFLVGASIFSACAPEIAKTTPTPLPEPTKTPFQPKREPTSTPTEPGVRTIENIFKLGAFDVASTKFTLETTPKLMALLGKQDPDDIRITHGDKPLPIIFSQGPSEEQRNVYKKSAKDNSSGNAYYVIGTNRRNHVLIDMHSFQVSAPGDIAREVGGWAYNNPDRLNELWGQKVILTPYGMQSLITEVQYTSTMSFKEYNEGKGQYSPWATLPNDGPKIALLEELGIPETIVNDKEPDVYYLTIAGCQNKYPGNIDAPIGGMSWDEAYELNTANTSLLTLKFKLP